MTESIIRYEADAFMPVMDIRQAKSRRDALVGFVQGIMVESQDFGKIPGTDKPTLLKPGAEKLVTFFGLSPVFVSERIVENFGDDGSEPLFFYRYRCELYRNGVLMGTGIGSCNSRESKYRYRNSERVCPQCGKPAIIKGKEEYGGGFLCFARKGGCGAKFSDTDASITSQQVGKVPNPDIADIVNTIDKMAQKRALIAATLISVNASEFFTQDVEDMNVGAEYTVIDATPRPTPAPQPQRQAAPTQGRQTPQPQRQPQPAQTQRPSTPAPQPPPVTEVTEPPADNPFEDDNAGHEALSRGEPITDKQLKMLHAVGISVYADGWAAKRAQLVEAVTKGEYRSAADLTKAEAKQLIDGLVKKQAALAPSAAELSAVPEMAH